MELRGDRPRPEGIRARGAGAEGRGLRRRQRDHPAQGGGSCARRRGLGGGDPDRSGKHPDLRRRARFAPRTPMRRGCSRRSLPRPPASGRWFWGREGLRGRRSGPWPVGERTSTSGTEPASAPTGSSATGNVGEGTEAEGAIAPVAAEQIGPVAYELIVNCTAVGLGGEDPFEQLPIDPGRLDAASDPRRPGLWRRGHRAGPGGAGEGGGRGGRARGPCPPGGGVASDLDRARAASGDDARGGQGGVD